MRVVDEYHCMVTLEVKQVKESKRRRASPTQRCFVRCQESRRKWQVSEAGISKSSVCLFVRSGSSQDYQDSKLTCDGVK
jgi:hypothetical protein